jgi:DNA modification methylase
MNIEMENDLFTVKQASEWATEYLGKNVTNSNIMYLIQYGRILGIKGNGTTLISKDDLIGYYDSHQDGRKVKWKEQLGKDLNWRLSFEEFKESETTKHVHRLHPYKGKFIPQLVEYFLDDHTDDFKKEVYFHEGDIILDPFCGSGTTLIQANEVGINAIGIDISAFNAFMSNIKIGKHNLVDIYNQSITNALRRHYHESNIPKFELKLTEALNKFNKKYFPSPDFRFQVRSGQMDQDQYGAEKEKVFLEIYTNLTEQYGIDLRIDADSEIFVDKWYLPSIRNEIDYVLKLIENIENSDTRDVFRLILSRTARSCRATTHADLATLVEPMTKSYYCAKHGKVCRPLFSILSWWERYSQDTIKRLSDFNKLRTNTYQICLTDDSRIIDIFATLKNANPEFANLAQEKKIQGIFSSPPYVGMIDYHEQHAYAYDFFGFERKDHLEIGPLVKGQNKLAKDSYVADISKVLVNCKRFLAPDYSILLVANDKFGLYPIIAGISGMNIVNQYKRPVLNRTEKDKGAYSEIIFQLKDGL